MEDKKTPSKKIVHGHISSSSVYRTELNAGNHTIISDEPSTVEGGNDEGPDPYDLLLMSLGSCTLMTIQMYAKRKGWKLGNMYIELRHHKTHAKDSEEVVNPNSRIDFIEKEITIEGELNQEQLDKLLEISKKCPVHRTLLSDVRFESSIEGSLAQD